ncbi:MAG: glycosyltransferase [Anaerolineae bacterium]|nr:glycosyltransferase [Anaerolineae bacterium]
MRPLQAALAAVDWRALRIVAFTAGAPLLAWRAHQVYRRLPQLAATHSAKCLPSLSIIIPARNEAENLSRLLPSLSAIDYPGDVEVIVVDDGSMDATAAVAARHGMRVIRVDEVPAGWLGKPHACQQGAQAARGDWLLFTDADTVHQPKAAAAAVAYAASHDLDGLSLWLRNEFRGTADGLALMVALAGLFAIPQARALLNGQFILLRRDVYWANGGHAPVAHEAMEDLALGRRLQALGYVVPLRRGERVAAARMYQSRMEWWSGLSRWGGRSLRWAGVGSFITGALITATMSPILRLREALAGTLQLRWVMVAWAVVTAGFLPWARSFGHGWWALLAPVGALLVQIAATWGLVRDVLGRGALWKDRTV